MHEPDYTTLHGLKGARVCVACSCAVCRLLRCSFAAVCHGGEGCDIQSRLRDTRILLHPLAESPRTLTLPTEASPCPHQQSMRVSAYLSIFRGRWLGAVTGACSRGPYLGEGWGGRVSIMFRRETRATSLVLVLYTNLSRRPTHGSNTKQRPSCPVGSKQKTDFSRR